MTETHGFLTWEGEQLYVVRHWPRSPCRGVVVLVAPIAIERTHGYLTWVRWARELAASGFDTVRFDPRGMGESTGTFASMTWHSWIQDVHRVAEYARALQNDVPLILHGARGGALLAAHAYELVRADRLLLWEAPKSARELMMEMLRRKLAADYAENTGATQKKTRQDYIDEIEKGVNVEVEGYPWSRGLWQSASEVNLPSTDEKALSLRAPRPFFWMESKTLRPDVGELFFRSIQFVMGGAPCA